MKSFFKKASEAVNSAVGRSALTGLVMAAPFFNANAQQGVAAKVTEPAANVVTIPPASKMPFSEYPVLGKNPNFSNALAAGFSQKGYTVLEIHGADPAIKKAAEDTMLGVYLSGRKNLILVIGDGDPKEWNIWAAGNLRSPITRADTSLANSVLTDEELRKAYDTYTVPTLKPEAKITDATNEVAGLHKN